MASARRKLRREILARKRPRPRRVKATTCKRTGKLGFANELDAVEALAGASKGGAKRFYRCEFCGHWHLTSKPKRGRQ